MSLRLNDMDWIKEVGPLAQTGSFGLACLLAFIIFKINGRHNDVIDKNTESHNILASAIAAHTEVIRSHTVAVHALERTIERKVR